MASNISLTSVVYLIFNQCKQPNSKLASTDKIIEYIMNNFDYNNEEVDQLQVNELFDKLKFESQFQNNQLSLEDFEKIFKKWIPIENQIDQWSDDEKSVSDSIFNNTQSRLSRSLTNLKLQIDNDNKVDYCDKWCHWDTNSQANDENIFEKCEELIELRSQSVSPHDDPFQIPLNVIRSTPIMKKKLIPSNDIGFLQQPNLRYIKNYKDLEQSSFSDTDVISKCDGSFFEADSNDSLSINRSKIYRKRHRSSIVGHESSNEFDSKDLVSQLRQIKFKNSQLGDINERLQSQLELAEDNIRNLNIKYMDMEKKSKYFSDINIENQQLIMEIEDIRKCMDSEIELKSRIQSEKIMTESELTSAKEYIQTLMDKLSILDAGLEEKNKIIMNLKSLIRQQEEFCIKLQDLNSEKEEELQKNQKGIKKLTDAIYEYEERIEIITKDKNELQNQLDMEFNRKEFISRENENHNTSITEFRDRACGGRSDINFQCTSQSEFKSNSSNNSPFSIKLELASELIDSPGDSPLCEKLYLNDNLFNDSSDDSSFEMLNGLLSMITSLRSTLSQYRQQLENASRTIKTSEHFSDEISLSYLSYLNDSINLLSSSTEKAANCQNQFNETFNLLMNRISMLRNEKKTLMLRNEKLLAQLNGTSDHSDSVDAEKIWFLEEQLRKERLSNIKNENEMKELSQSNNTNVFSEFSICPHCGKRLMELEKPPDHILKDDLNNIEGKRRNTVGEIYHSLVNNKRRSRMSSASLGDLNIKTTENPLNTNDPLLSPDIDTDQEIDMFRNYNISTENLSNIPRYRISRTSTANIDIENLIENSWLEQSSKFEERRASVFVQMERDFNQFNESDNKGTLETIAIKEFEQPMDVTNRTRSSSCSSSNDTSDANSVDSHEERKKLALQLENRSLRMQSRSPAPTLLNCSLLADDLKSITPTFNEMEQFNPLDNHNQVIDTSISLDVPNSHGSSPLSHSPNLKNDDFINLENTSYESPRERKQSIIRSNHDNILSENTDVRIYSNGPDVWSELPTISIIQPALNAPDNAEINESTNENNLIHDAESLQIDHTSSNDNNIEGESSSLQAFLYSSSSANDEVRQTRSSSKLRPKRLSRPHTVTGGNIFKSVQDDTISNCDDPSVNGDITDIQEAIDMLNETSRSLVSISSDDLESKYAEAILMYRTDRPTIIDRAMDANNKCNKALTNVEQEFNILRHLIKNMSIIVDQPCDVIPRMKTSINVLEKCVEYLSAKSETLGSIQQELKLACLADVMLEYRGLLQKQKEDHMKEIEELKNSVTLLNEMGLTNSLDPSRPKRSILAGKDPKTRFQIVAQNTATKTSILRQLSNASNRVSELSAAPDFSTNDCLKHDSKPLSSRSSNKLFGFSDIAKKVMDNDNFKSRHMAVNKFFPSSAPIDDCGDNTYQKGLTQGLRIVTDQALTDLRAQQSKFSTSLDSLADMIEDYDTVFETVQPNHIGGERISLIKDKMIFFISNLKCAIGRIAYITIGVIVMVGLLLPWLFIPANNDASSFSVPVSRKPSNSLPDSSHTSDRRDSSSHSPFLSNINVVRHNPAAV